CARYERLYSRLRGRHDRNVESAGVWAIVQDADVRGACVFGGLIRDHATGIVILLEVNGIGRADHQPQAASFCHSASDKESGIEIAADGFADLDQVLLPDRLTIAQSSHIAPKSDAGSVRQNFIELARDIGLGNTR